MSSGVGSSGLHDVGGLYHFMPNILGYVNHGIPFSRCLKLSYLFNRETDGQAIQRPISNMGTPYICTYEVLAAIPLTDWENPQGKNAGPALTNYIPNPEKRGGWSIRSSSLMMELVSKLVLE